MVTQEYFEELKKSMAKKSVNALIREFNKQVAFVKANIDSVDFDCVINVFTRDFHITEETVRRIFDK